MPWRCTIIAGAPVLLAFFFPTSYILSFDPDLLANFSCCIGKSILLLCFLFSPPSHLGIIDYFAIISLNLLCASSPFFGGKVHAYGCSYKAEDSIGDPSLVPPIDESAHARTEIKYVPFHLEWDPNRACPTERIRFRACSLSRNAR